MKLLLAAILVVFMNAGPVHAEETAAPEVPAQPPAQAEGNAAPDAVPAPSVEAEGDAAPDEPKPAKPDGPITAEAAAEKLGIDLSKYPEVLEEIKRDAAKRAAKPVAATTEQPADRLEAPKITYDRTQRLNRPMDRVIEFRNAQSVVTNEIQYNNLPETIRLDLQQALGACPESVLNSSDLKAYSYVSDLQRSRGLSPNYFIDFSKLKSKKDDSCAAAPCNAEGCLLISYNTIGYGRWKKDATLRVKEWALKQVDDQSASPVPQAKKPTMISYFDLTTLCGQTEEAEECHTNRIWLSGGLGSYTPPQ